MTLFTRLPAPQPRRKRACRRTTGGTPRRHVRVPAHAWSGSISPPAPTDTSPRSATAAARRRRRSPSAQPSTGPSTTSRRRIPTLIDAAQSTDETTQLVAEQLRRRGMTRATVAIDASVAPQRFVDARRAELPGLRLVEASGVLETLRTIKRPHYDRPLEAGMVLSIETGGLRRRPPGPDRGRRLTGRLSAPPPSAAAGRPRGAGRRTRSLPRATAR